ncbi:SDR family oxidoreductase [Salinimonas marina]|uniref:SDR family oxidoreductase n=1 Tax=Salinimonas marina TaxID=2785918 RepID=A0A7S9DYC5_9ALTE|nr:SDR family oxidoreductase [Salinimonas marina]QPG06251.1 SDR family oxidoreductase [Salinimonas marina]
MSDQQYPTPPFSKQDTGELPGEEQSMDPRPEFTAEDYKSAGKLSGKVALITGGDSGIGRSVAVLFAREGAKITFTYLPEEEQDARATVKHVQQAGGEALMIPFDVTDQGDCEKVVNDTLKQFGQLDILVNNAAFQNHVADVESLSFEQWDKTFQTNIYGYFKMVKAALPHMTKGATIINTGSITGLEGSAGLLDYSSTKGAIHAFTKTLAQELVERGIRVNCVAPGPVWTPLNPAERSRESAKHFGEKTPYGRPAQPEEMAPTYVYLASNADSGYLTGQIITLLGGSTRAG